MKTVQSHVLSSDPISLSDATSFLSAFNKSVCGGGGAASLAASHETCWFVRRALASFEELEQLHHKLKGPKSDRNRRSESQNEDLETAVGDNPAQSFVSSRDVSSMPTSHRHDDDIDRKVAVEEESKGGGRNLKDGGEIAEIDDNNNNKKKKEKKVKGAIGNIGENGGRVEEGDSESEMRNGEVKREKKKKKKKKRDNVDESGGGIKEEEDGEGKMGSEEAKKEEKKKRKSEVLENGEVDALEEQQEKRKKRRKS